MTDLNSKGLREDSKDKKWERVQIKAFTVWVNSSLEPLGRKVEDIGEDFKDGVNLDYFLEEVTHSSLPRWNKQPALRVHKIENIGIGLRFIQGDLGVRLVGIGPEDIADGNLKLTLGTLYSLFRKLRIETIREQGESAENGLLAWIRKMTDGYPNVDIKNFRESFNDGMAFSALIHAMDNDAIDFIGIDPKDKEANIIRAFEIAEKKLGIPKLLEVEDLMNNNVDERSVILYNSLFFHAWMADEEKRKLRADKESFQDELARLRQENERFRAENATLTQTAEDYAARIKALEDEIAFLRQINKEGNDLRRILEDKIHALQKMLAELQNAHLHTKGADGQDRDGSDSNSHSHDSQLERDLAEMDRLRKEGQKLSDLLDQLANQRDGLITDAAAKAAYLKALEDRKAALQNELAQLQAQLEREIARRKEQDRIIAELRKQLEQLRSKQIVHSQAHLGLETLRVNLLDHLEDLYRWREFHKISDEELEAINVSQISEDISSRSFEQQISFLDEKLRGENHNLGRIIKLQQTKDYLDDVVLHKDWLLMKGRKEWRRRYFVLSGDRLSYYEDEDITKECIGTIELDVGCDVVRQQAITDEESKKKLWPLKVTVGDRKLFVRAATKSLRHIWFAALISQITILNYTKAANEAKERLDTRLVSVLKAKSLPVIHLGNRPFSTHSLAALSKGILGFDELEDIALVNSDLTDDQFNTFSNAIEKLPQLKRFNFSKNKLTSGIANRFVEVINFSSVEDIDVSNNQLDDSFLEALVPKIVDSSSIHTLALDGNKFTATGAATLGSGLSKGAFSVPELSLSNNHLSDAGVEALVPLLKRVAFKKVNLAGNGITDKGAISLSEALLGTSIEEINLSNNKIGPKGALAIRKLLDQNHALAKVYLSGNDSIASSSEAAGLFVASNFVLSDLTFTRN